ncbi:SitI3 family protein [Actinoplanes sp. CA-142083]|uniref:SitI3 family protein n=1 Tax=Actinoplanes sp. CA-142083 TaxID=3239903 RepID=UPI003D8FC4E0
MATEYTWYGDADVDTDSLRAFIATTTGGEQHADGTVFFPGMYVSSARAEGDDVNPAVELFGFKERFSATFRLSKQADEPAQQHATALMAHTLIAFATRFGGHGVLLFNGEDNILQYGEGTVTFGAEWEDWAENPETAPLLTQFPSRVLPQPLL